MQTFRKLPTISPKRKRIINQGISSEKDPAIEEKYKLYYNRL